MDFRWQVFSVGKSESLTQPIQIQLCPKPEIFSVFLLNSWNLYQVLNISQKKDAADSWLISKIIDCKKHGFLDA